MMSEDVRTLYYLGNKVAASLQTSPGDRAWRVDTIGSDDNFVTVNTISPGFIATKMVTNLSQDVLDTKIIPQIPVGRLGQPAEVAALVLYLCSHEAGFVTGANIAINGGQHLQ
jgi:NAD(P)-dependent dehydrogenase (short-subunit alcohol dehydrogenase family)